MTRFVVFAALLSGAVVATGSGMTSAALAQSIDPSVVYFGPGATDLGAAARTTLEETARAYRALGSDASVVVSGHTDDARPAADAVRESQVRASNVRDYLVSLGVPVGSITTEAFGATRPAVDRPTGVAEPANRRVEITFGPGSGW